MIIEGIIWILDILIKYIVRLKNQPSINEKDTALKDIKNVFNIAD